MTSGPIHIPGQPRREPNSLALLEEMLALALDKSNQHLTNIETALNVLAVNSKQEDRHIYALSERGDGSWGSYCLACSEEAKDYIYPCAKYQGQPYPPSHITVIEISPDTPVH